MQTVYDLDGFANKLFLAAELNDTGTADSNVPIIR